MEVRWNIIKKCALDTVSDFIGKVNRNARKQWIPQGMINKISQRGKLKNVKTKNEGRKNYRILRNELKRAADKVKYEYLESVCDDFTEFQIPGRYDLWTG